MSRQYSYRIPYHRDENKKTLDELFDAAHRENIKTKKVITSLFLLFILISISIIYYLLSLKKSVDEISKKLDFEFEEVDVKIKETERGLLDKQFDIEKEIDKQIEINNKQFAALESKLEKQEKKIAELQKYFNSPYKSEKKQYPKNVQLASALVDRGFSKEGAAAIVGNIAAESDFKTDATDGKAVGLMQWQDGRLTKLKAFAKQKGKSYLDESVQLDYIAWELRGGNKKETKNFNKAKKLAKGNVKQFAYHVAKHVERPADWALEQSKNKRMNVALSTYKQLEELV